MLSVQNVSVQFGQRRLFNELSFLINKQDRIGLVGRNGAGKSTLLKIIAKEQTSDTGEVTSPKGFTVGYLPQEMNHAEETSILEEASSAFSEVNSIQERIETINEELVNRTDYESEAYNQLLVDLHDLNDRLTVLDGFNVQEKVERVLAGLGFEPQDFQRQMKEFSGGWKMRVELAKVLLQNPDLILLDEPTNHLDIESIQWLEDFLKVYQGAILLISHDRTFLDTVTNRTIELLLGKAYDYKYSYSKYVQLREEELIRQADSAKQQKKYIDETEQLINKFRAKKNKAAFAQSLIKKLDKLERVEVDDSDRRKMTINFPPAPRSGKAVLEAKKLSKRYGELQVIQNLEFIVGRGDRIAFIGKNGVGKTTLSKMIVGVEEHEGELTVGHNVSVGYYAQNQAELLNDNKTVLQTIEDETTPDMEINCRSLLGSFMFSGEDVDKKVKVLSGGEKSRLAFCRLLLKPYNLLVLDEPTNHLDIRSKEVLKEALQSYTGTMIIVSHDRDFLTGLTDRIYEFQKGRVRTHHGEVQDFLKAQKAASIKEFEQTPKAAKKEEKAATKSENKLSYEERKQIDRDIRKLNNRIAKCEKEIESGESKMKTIEAEMAGDNTPERAKELYENYATLEKEVTELMQVWEDSAAALEKLSN